MIGAANCLTSPDGDNCPNAATASIEGISEIDSLIGLNFCCLFKSA